MRPEFLETDAAVAQAAAWGCQPVEVVRTTERSHIFTHVEWKMKGVLMTCQTPAEAFVWRTAEEIAQELSLPTAFRQFSAFYRNPEQCISSSAGFRRLHFLADYDILTVSIP